MRVTPIAAAAALILALTAGSAGADTSPSPGTAVGGPMLAAHGVVAQPMTGTPAPPRGLSAASWLVADADTGDVLGARDAHARHLPASTLKILTAVTLLPRLQRTALVRASYDDASVDGSKVGLVPGMRYTVDTLFKAMLVVSGNDAAGALAEAAGGMHRTVDLMNAEARHLQAYDTVARTPSGLDARGESTSAYDLALIARAGLQMPAFRHYIGIVRSRVPAPHHKHFQIYTHDQLLTSYRGAIGVKNGYTVAANATYVGAATRHGHTILITLMDAQPNFWDEARRLLDWGFAADGHVVPVGTLVGPATATAQVAPAPTSHRTTVVLATHRASGVAGWQLALLAASAALALVVTAHRQRRRIGSRLSLPPL